jgi:hypothetical protein
MALLVIEKAGNNQKRKKKDMHAHIRTDRQTDRKTHRQTHRHTHADRHRQTDKQTHRRTENWIDQITCKSTQVTEHMVTCFARA